MTFLLMGAVFLVVGLACVRALVGLVRQERKLADGVTVAAEVVDFETKTVTRSSSTGGRRQVTQYYPVLRFAMADGREQRCTSQYAWKGQVGKPVQVTYAREDPTLVRVKGNNVAKIGIPLVGGVGGLFSILGVVFLTVGLGDL